jgi:hypothetical protein
MASFEMASDIKTLTRNVESLRGECASITEYFRYRRNKQNEIILKMSQSMDK